MPIGIPESLMAPTDAWFTDVFVIITDLGKRDENIISYTAIPTLLRTSIIATIMKTHNEYAI
jgi:hypothetical protein